ncbi:DUF6395 domain-containing protein [Cohnella suwonensis]|uniref:DUF6395 domain-containing protein n=1 Tax=Cohnella suwonensis TaxID=696072 RepID=A0ABW0LVT3_9BACL
MKINYRAEKGVLEYRFSSQPDYQSGVEVRMAKQSCVIHMPADWDIGKVHPDVLALAAILIIYPFAGSKIVVPQGVSQPFHDHFKRTTKKEILPVDPYLIPRQVPNRSSPALAYSGGVDSTAALMLLPPNACSIFLERITPMNQQTLYNKEAALYACRFLRKEGRSVYTIKTDLEYVRDPVGFPVDVANAVPALLLSDYVGLDSVAWGTVMDSTYQIGNLKYADYAQRLHFNRWGKLFELVGMPFNQVTGGICEVGTSLIVLNSRYRSIARSCMRGNGNGACGECWKCFRKGLLERALERTKPSNAELDRLFSLSSVEMHLTKFPIHSENIIAYITAHYDGDHPIMNKLKKRTRGDKLQVRWMEKWYSPSINLLPAKYRAQVQTQIKKYLKVMNAEEERQAESWDLGQYRSSHEYQQYSTDLMEALETYRAQR